MKNFAVITLALLVSVGAASAQVDPTNPNTVLYADEFLGADGTGSATLDPAAYNGRELDTDGYVQAAPGETFTIHMIVNGYYLDGWPQFGSYRTAFWYDYNITERGVENRTWTDYYTFAWPIYVTDYTGYTMIDRYEWGGSQASFYAGQDIVSWDFTVLESATIGATMEIGLEARFWMASMAGGYLDANATSNYGALTLEIVAPDLGRFGDFNDDDLIDAVDIDMLGAAIQAGSLDLAFDMDGNGLVEQADFDLHVTTLVDTLIGLGSGTMFGDFNLDGVVDLIDLGMVGDEYGLGTGWATGDSNGDGAVDLIDLGAVGDNYGFTATAPIPEPATMTLLALGGIALIRRKK